MKYALSDTIHMVALDKIPIPVAGVALGTASLGNLLNAYSETAHWLCFGIALLFILLLLGRLIVDPESIRRDLCDPVIAGVSGTFPMALMVMSTYISGSYYELALAIWGSAIIMHILLMIHYTRKFIIGMDMKKIFASTFIVYVGIAVAGVTSPFLDMRTIGSVTVYFGALVLIPLFVLISKTYVPPVVHLLGTGEPLYCRIHAIVRSYDAGSADTRIHTRMRAVRVRVCYNGQDDRHGILSQLCGTHLPSGDIRHRIEEYVLMS